MRRRRRWRRARSEANPGNSHGRSHTKRDTLQSRHHVEMVRQFKHHEKKLLKKVDFFNVRRWFLFFVTSLSHRSNQWKQDANLREIKVMRRYHIQDREDYHKSVLAHATSSSKLTHPGNKVQQAVRVTAVLSPSDRASPSPRFLPHSNGGTNSLEAL
jgi:hypothetical protein